MSAVLKVRNADGDLEEVLTFPREGWTVEESAEEGNASQTQVAIPDPDLSIDPTHLVGWRRAIIYETDSEIDNTVLFSGFVSIQEIGRTGGEFVEPLGRVWVLSLVDMNTLFDNRLLVGSDTDRSAETDVERVTWVAGTEEMGYFDDLSFVSADDPEDLDARDTARTTCKQVFDEASQQSGKNYWIGANSNDGIFLWYGHDSEETYSSDLRLSNDPADWNDDELADGTSLVWPISFDAKLTRDPNRVYDGALVEYEGGAVFRKNPATSAFFTLSGRDISVPAPEIKSKTKAQRRGDRMLADLDTQDEVLTCTVRLPKEKGTMIRAGMRIPVKATHLPGWEAFGWCRVLKCSVTAVQAGEFYDLGLTLQGPPSGDIVLETITLVATNNVTVDGERNASDNDTASTLTAGQVWRYTIVNTQHDPTCWTDALQLSYGTPATTYIRGWGASFGFVIPVPADYDPPANYTGTAYPEPAMTTQTGTFVIATTTSTFDLRCKGNYQPGTVLINEQWTCTLERIS